MLCILYIMTYIGVAWHCMQHAMKRVWACAWMVGSGLSATECKGSLLNSYIGSLVSTSFVMDGCTSLYQQTVMVQPPLSPFSSLFSSLPCPSPPLPASDSI